MRALENQGNRKIGRGVASLDRKFVGLKRGSCSNVPTGISTAVLEVEDGVVHLVAEKALGV